jgi:hypothetical protein
MPQVEALKPLDRRNPQFNAALPPSRDNPVSVKCATGDVFEMDEQYIETHVALGNVKRATIAAPASKPNKPD